MMTAVMALVAGLATAGITSAAPVYHQSTRTQQALKAGLARTQTTQLQREVDDYLAKHPGWRQIVAQSSFSVTGGCAA